MVVIKDNVIKSYADFRRRRKAVTTGIITTGLIILLIAALSYYGIHVGSFVIKLNDMNDKKALALTLDNLDDPTSYETLTTTTRLAADPLKNCTDAEYSDIPMESITENTGVKNAFNNAGNEIYFAYSFYLMNAGSEAFDYAMELKVNAVSKGLDEVLRFMVIENDDYENRKVYAKSQPDGTPEEILVGEVSHGGNTVSLGQTIPFSEGYEKDGIIFNETIKDFYASAHTKYTIVMWLDGWDAQETDDMLGGGLKLGLDFYILDEDSND